MSLTYLGLDFKNQWTNYRDLMGRIPNNAVKGLPGMLKGESVGGKAVLQIDELKVSSLFMVGARNMHRL